MVIVEKAHQKRKEELKRASRAKSDRKKGQSEPESRRERSRATPKANRVRQQQRGKKMTGSDSSRVGKAAGVPTRQDKSGRIAKSRVTEAADKALRKRVKYLEEIGEYRYSLLAHLGATEAEIKKEKVRDERDKRRVKQMRKGQRRKGRKESRGHSNNPQSLGAVGPIQDTRCGDFHTKKRTKTPGRLEISKEKEALIARHLQHRNKETRDKMLRTRISKVIGVREATQSLELNLPRITATRRAQKSRRKTIVGIMEERIARRDFRALLPIAVMASLRTYHKDNKDIPWEDHDNDREAAKLARKAATQSAGRRDTQLCKMMGSETLATTALRTAKWTVPPWIKKRIGPGTGRCELIEMAPWMVPPWRNNMIQMAPWMVPPWKNLAVATCGMNRLTDMAPWMVPPWQYLEAMTANN